MLKKKLVVGLLAVTTVAALALSGCSSSNNSSSASGSKSYKIGLLLPETDVPRYATQDKPYFTAEIKKVCPDCTVVYQNANSKASAQQAQAKAMITQGVKVLVIDPVDGAAAGGMVKEAKASGIPVVAYDRVITSPDLKYVISNDYLQVGKLQGAALVAKLKKDNVPTSDDGIIMINGATTDPNAAQIKKGALSQITPSGYQVLSETDTWDPPTAQTWVAGQIAKYGHKIVGVYSANDENGGGAISSFKSAGWSTVPPLTGLDATIAGLQQLLVGEQYMTTYNDFAKEAKSAADVAFQLAEGKTPSHTATLDGHPAELNPPQAVFATNIESTIIASKFYTASQICTSAYAAACTKYGVQ